ncbi:MAG: FAD-dependent oxidoreductase, partial [Gemmatimonadaceae bacterium]
QQLASKLPNGVVRTSTRVQTLRVDGGCATGVVLVDGTTINAANVVIATEPAGATALTSMIGMQQYQQIESRGSTSVYFTSESAPLPGRSLWLNAEPNAIISHAITLTQVAPEYAPGKHLLVATAVGESANLSDSQLEDAARSELARMATVANVGAFPESFRVAVRRVPYSQFAQPPGFVPAPPEFNGGPTGLWRASELMHSSSLEGAARGGQHAARALLARNAGT